MTRQTPAIACLERVIWTKDRIQAELRAWQQKCVYAYVTSGFIKMAHKYRACESRVRDTRDFSQIPTN